MLVKATKIAETTGLSRRTLYTIAKEMVESGIYQNPVMYGNPVLIDHEAFEHWITVRNTWKTNPRARRFIKGRNKL